MRIFRKFEISVSSKWSYEIIITSKENVNKNVQPRSKKPHKLTRYQAKLKRVWPN